MSGTRQPGRNREIVVVTGTMTLSPHHVGKTILVESSASCTLTLPTPEQCLKGGDILIINAADQTLIISLNELLIAKNSLAADSVTFSTAGELIGTAVTCVNTGSKWAVLTHAEEAVSQTVTAD
jgi:hypothetical protein